MLSWMWDFFANVLFANLPMMPATGICSLGLLRLFGDTGIIIGFVSLAGSTRSIIGDTERKSRFFVAIFIVIG